MTDHGTAPVPCEAVRKKTRELITAQPTCTSSYLHCYFRQETTSSWARRWHLGTLASAGNSIPRPGASAARPCPPLPLPEWQWQGGTSQLRAVCYLESAPDLSVAWESSALWRNSTIWWKERVKSCRDAQQAPESSCCGHKCNSFRGVLAQSCA